VDFEKVLLSGIALSIIKEAFRDQIRYWSEAFKIFFVRPFQKHSVEEFELYNPSYGSWERVRIEKFRLSFSRAKNGVFLEYLDESGTPFARERLPFSLWADLRKRQVYK
jgi:hypothetical protein